MSVLLSSEITDKLFNFSEFQCFDLNEASLTCGGRIKCSIYRGYNGYRSAQPRGTPKNVSLS